MFLTDEYRFALVFPKSLYIIAVNFKACGRTEQNFSENKSISRNVLYK